MAGNVMRFSRDSTPVDVEQRMTGVLWVLIAVQFTAIIASFTGLHLRVDLRSNPQLICVAAVYAATACFYVWVRRDPVVSMAIISVGQLFIILFFGLLLTYAASAAALPLRDAELHSWDLRLGFDRQMYQAFLDRHLRLSAILDAAYLSIQPQTIVVPMLLILTGQMLRLQTFILAFGIALSATSIISVFVPAMDALIYVDLAPLRREAIPSDIYSHIRTLDALRSGAMSTIRLNDLEGLLTFPSFHTANAVLFAWAVWRVRYVWIIGLVINALMIASTPITGQHYGIDVIAGAIVAMASILAAKRVKQTNGRLNRRADLQQHAAADLQ